MIIFIGSGGGYLSYISIILFVAQALEVSMAGTLLALGGFFCTLVAIKYWLRRNEVRSPTYFAPRGLADDILLSQNPTLWDILHEIVEGSSQNRRRREGMFDDGRNNRANSTQSNSTNSNATMDKVVHIIQKMPTEEYLDESALRSISVHELKKRLANRNIDHSKCVERQELVELLQKHRGGQSSSDTCCICYCEFEAGDVMRVLRNCRHEYHLECLDKWAYTAADNNRSPSCPLCNQHLE